MVQVQSQSNKNKNNRPGTFLSAIVSHLRILATPSYGVGLMTPGEFIDFIEDSGKWIDGNISWSDDEDHSPAIEFRAPLVSHADYPVFIRGSVNVRAATLTFAVIHRAFGRIYGLDLGKEHRNPDGQMIGPKHKHAWRDLLSCAKFAYSPDDISAQLPDVAAVWSQFCDEAKIEHRGRLILPDSFSQMELFG